LVTPLTFDINVSPIQLPGEDYILEEGTNCSISGWRRVTDNTEEGDPIPSDVLRKVNVPIVSIEACKESSSTPSLLDDNNILCAGSLTGLLFILKINLLLTVYLMFYLKEMLIFVTTTLVDHWSSKAQIFKLESHLLVIVALQEHMVNIRLNDSILIFKAYIV